MSLSLLNNFPHPSSGCLLLAVKRGLLLGHLGLSDPQVKTPSHDYLSGLMPWAMISLLLLASFSTWQHRGG